MPAQQMFATYNPDAYSRMRLGRLFGLYLSMSSQEQLHSADSSELEKVTAALMSRSLREKAVFCKALTDPGLQERYCKNFLSIS